MTMRLALMLGASFLSSAALADAPTLIRGAAVFDGDRAVGIKTVLIADGKIANPDYKGKPPKGAMIIEGKGKTLMPGMIDAHVHAYAGLDTPLLFGVTTQLDMFSPPTANAEIRAKSKSGQNRTVADLFSAGYLASVAGGHGSQFGIQVPFLTGPGDADAWVAARVAEGSDYIKIVIEDGSTVGRPIPTLDAATVTALVAAARKRGKLSVVHVQSEAAAKIAIDAGANGLVHLFADKAADPAMIAKARAQDMFITPTYSVFEGFAGRNGSAALLSAPGLTGLLPKMAVTTVTQSMGPDRTARIDPNMQANIRAFAAAGVPILAGTDAGNPAIWYGLSMHREIELLVKSGLTPVQALTAATAAPARAYRLTDRGRIAKGMKADLLLVDGDPTRDITVTRNIAGVWINGSDVTALRAARRAEVAKEGQGAGAAAPTIPTGGRISAFTSVAAGAAMAAPFGNWIETTDAMMGGGSKLTLSVTGKAPSGEAALVMTGDVKQGAFVQWAGIGFMPGAQPFAPANLKAVKAIRFFARGEGKGFGLMAFSEASGQRPITAPFAAGAAWAEVTIPFADLKGFDPAGAQMLSFNALQPGPFRLEIADVRLVTE
jgi:imidazolonepropionase-like amidohydrolase